MLNIKYDSNYKNVVNKIIEEINEKLKTYIIYDDDLLKCDKSEAINKDRPEETLSYREWPDYVSPFHLFTYEYIKTTIDKDRPEDYLYTELCFTEELIKNYKSLNNIETNLAIKILNENGIYLKTQDGNKYRYTLVGIRKDKIEYHGEIRVLNIKYISKYKDIANEIINQINTKMDIFDIISGVCEKDKYVFEHTDLMKKGVIESKYLKPYQLFDYENIVKIVEILRCNQFNIEEINIENKDDYYYIPLCFDYALIDKYDKLNETESALINKYLSNIGLFVKYMGYPNSHTLVVIKKEFIN